MLNKDYYPKIKTVICSASICYFPCKEGMALFSEWSNYTTL